MDLKVGDLVRLTRDEDWYPSPESPYEQGNNWPEGTSFMISSLEHWGDEDDEDIFADGAGINLRALLNGQIIEIDTDIFADSMEKM